MADDITLAEVQTRLDAITREMLELIRAYDLDADHPLKVIEVARHKIDDGDDYVRFLELSLEGRILGEVADQLMGGMTPGNA